MDAVNNYVIILNIDVLQGYKSDNYFIEFTIVVILK